MKSMFPLIVVLLRAGAVSAYHLPVRGSSPRAVHNHPRQEEESVSPGISTLPDTSPSLVSESPTDIPINTSSSITSSSITSSSSSSSNSNSSNSNSTPGLSFPTGTTTTTATATITIPFTPSTGTGIPSGAAPPFPTGIFNSSLFPTGTGSPVTVSVSVSVSVSFSGPGLGGPTSSASIDCSALASSIFGSIFPSPTGWPGPYPSGGGGDDETNRSESIPTPIPISLGTPSVFPPIPTDTGGPILGVPTSDSDSLPVSSLRSTTTAVEPSWLAKPATRTVLYHSGRENGGHGRRRPMAAPHGDGDGPIGPIPSGVFPPGSPSSYGPFPTGIFPKPKPRPTLTDEQAALISEFFEVCGGGGGYWWFPITGRGNTDTHAGGDGKQGCDGDGAK